MAHFHHISIFNQNQSISNLVIFEQNTKAIALLFGQKWLIFITFQSSIKINQFQIWSFLSKIPRPLLFGQIWLIFITIQSSINNQSISNLVIFEQNTKAIALLFGQKWLIFITFSIFNQNQSISNLVIFEQNTKAIAVLFGQKWLLFITIQSSIKINQFQIWSFLSKIPRL